MNIRVRIGVALLVAATLSTSALAGATSSTKTGTAAQVAHLVATSHTITKVDSKVAGELSSQRLDPQLVYPVVRHGCSTATQCVFGDVKANRTVVLFGDSHAMMWLPAMIGVANADHLRLVLLWAPACPASNVKGYDYTEEVVAPGYRCPKWRAVAFGLIAKMRPIAVLIGERTAAIVHASDRSPFTTKEWTPALESTINRIKSKATKVAVLEDLVFFDSSVPPCLASYPSAVQTCSEANPSPTFPGQQAAERAAAKTTGTTFFPTRQWFCVTRCSPIVGEMVTYYNASHASAIYTAYLAGVMGTALAKVLR